MCAHLRVGDNEKIEQCFLDGVTDCKETNTCNECIHNDIKWHESWLNWDKVVVPIPYVNLICDRPA
jgi:hypothetical protein